MNGKIKISKKHIIVAVIAAAIAVAVIALVIGAVKGKASAEIENSGVEFFAEGGLFKGRHSENSLKSSEKKGVKKISFSASAEFENLEDIQPDEFGFSLNGVPEKNILLGATAESQSIFLKKGCYGKMVRAKAKEKNFRPGQYYYSEDGQSFKIVEVFNKKEAKRYYTLEKIGTVSEDFYPMIYTLESDYTVEGLNVRPETSGDSLLKISSVIMSALSGNKKYETNQSEKNVNTTVLTAENIEYSAKTDLRSWVKLTEEKLSWQVNKTAESEKAKEILAMLEDFDPSGSLKREKTVIVVYSGVNGTQKPASARAVNSDDFCLSTSFNLEISFMPAELNDGKGEM